VSVRPPDVVTVPSTVVPLMRAIALASLSETTLEMP
jgi:hypothetical protein